MTMTTQVQCNWHASLAQSLLDMWHRGVGMQLLMSGPCQGRAPALGVRRAGQWQSSNGRIDLVMQVGRT